MGCDIHCYIEYTEGGEQWYSFGGCINPGRNYVLFGLLAGVRSETEPLVPCRGIPLDCASEARRDNWLYISDELANEEGCCSHAQAESYVKYGCQLNEDQSRVTHPDWHSHSWLTMSEFENVLEVYESSSHYNLNIEYRAVLAVMKEFCHAGQSRLVFWFDN